MWWCGVVLCGVSGVRWWCGGGVVCARLLLGQELINNNT